ncbi:MAG: TonB-dependent receptor [Aquificaceae bacterium]|nr:TonB-dependent receptor [Aquificaceae bacterium]MDW8423365.1 TonB-dependent receptor [Aquificaceae bacterium]
MKKVFLLGAVFSLPVFAQEVLLKEVEVKGKRETFKDSLEIREVRESFAKDVGEALQKLEGIHKVRKAGIANDVVIRVFQRDNINVLIDDTEVHGACPNRMDPPAFHVDFSEVEKIEVIKGPFDIRHQGSMGGLVNIITKKPDMGFRIRLNATAGSFNFINFSPTVSYRDEKFYGLAGYSYKYSKPYKDGDGKRITEYAAGHPTPPNSAYRPEKVNSKAFDINTYWAKFGLSPIKDHLFEITYTRQEADHVLYPALRMDAIYDDTDRLNLTYSVKDRLKLQFYFTQVKHDMTDQYRRSSVGAPRPYSMKTYAETKTYGGRVEGKLGDITLGLEAYKRNWEAINYRATYATYRPVYMIPDVDITNVGIYGEYDKKLGKNLRFVAGLRLDTTESEVGAKDGSTSPEFNTNLYNTVHNTRSTSKRDTYPSGNLQLFYNITPELELFAGLGHAVRVPDPQERYTYLPGVWVGNPKLKPSKNTEIDIGLKHQTPKSLTKATVFLSYVQDYITVNRRANAITYANVDARFWGFELSSTYNLFGSFFLLGGASYTEGRKDRKPGININDRDVAEVPPLKGRIGVRYDKGTWFIETETVASATQNKVDSDLQELKTSGWAIVNLKAGINYKGLSLNAGVENLLDKKYFEHFSYIRHPFRGARVPEPGRSFYVSATYQF